MTADVKRFTSRYAFPATSNLGDEMYLGAGADLEPDTLLYAYSHGFFPWYEKAPILWCSPPQRMILGAGEIHIGRSLKKALKKSAYKVSKNTAFKQVIHLCGATREETWITPEMETAYTELHRLGWAHSWECWATGGREVDSLHDVAGAGDCAYGHTAADGGQDVRISGDRSADRLVGGIYGVVINRAAFLESTFHLEPNAGKQAFVAMYGDLFESGVELFDFQVQSEIAESFGAYEVSRAEFERKLQLALA